MYDLIEREYGTCPTLIGEADGNLEIGRFLHLKSRNPKSQIGLRGLADQAESNLRFRISGFEILESSNFKNVLQPGYDDQGI
jgi:hypothetical protein